MPENIIALDVGEKRIGVARANTVAKIPTPIATLANDENFTSSLKELLLKDPTDTIVVGRPRSLDGNETKQTQFTKEFVDKYLKDYKIIWQDETLSSKQASKHYSGKFGLDADAACIILEDYLGLNYEV